MLMNAASLSVAGVEDISALEQLVNRAYRGDSARAGWTHEADLLGGQRIDSRSIRELLKNDAVIIIKFTEEGVITGCVCLEKQEKRLYLGMLTVMPNRQGAGIGKVLLGAAEAHARQLGLSVIEMTVITARTELIAWYERRGYINTGHVKPFPLEDPRFGIPKAFLEFVVLEKQI